MIDSKEKLKRVLEREMKFYRESYCEKKRDALIRIITKDPLFIISKYQKYLRLSEYYYNTNKMIMYALYRYKRNSLGSKLGFEIWENNFDEGLIIDHYGPIIVNREARIGKNCRLHGDNCIGNKGTGKCPVIGDNADIGVGAKIIGEIELKNNVTVGAGAIVNKTFAESNIKIVGVPAKKIGD